MHEDTLTIHWMTDLHLKDTVTGLPDAAGAIYAERHYYAALDKLQQSVEIIGAIKPDLVVCTGDVIDGRQPLRAFAEQWERIRSPKAFVLGNHDLDAGYSAVVAELGYSEEPEIAGSRFTRSFPLQKGDVRVRILILDTYVGEDGQHRYDTCEGTIGPAAFEWLEQEMMGCPEPVILLFSHNGMEGPAAYFDQRHAERFRELARRLTQTGKRLYNLAGHHHVHPQALVKEIVPGYTYVNGVAMIVGPLSYLNVLHVQKDGTLDIEYEEVRYRSTPHSPK